MAPYQNPYQNPHQPMPGFSNPGMGRPMGPQPGYQGPQGPQYPQQGYPQPQGPQYPQQGYNQPQGPLAQGGYIQVVNTQQGLMYMDTRSGNILGPVSQQPQNTGRQMPMGPAQGGYVSQEPLYHNRFGVGPQGNPEYDAPSDNRYGGIQQLTTRSPAMTTTPVPVTPAPALVKVSAPATPPNGKNTLHFAKFKPEHRSIPFLKKDLQIEDKSIIGESLQQLITGLIDTAHSDENPCVAWTQCGIVIHKFYGTTTIDHEEDLFQTDIEAIYKVLKRLLPEIERAEDVVYFQAYNTWLTECVNDYLLISATVGTTIDSFAEDFNDLMRYLLANDPVKREGLIDHMSGLLSQAIADVQAIREIGESGESVVPRDVSIVPARATLVYVKLMGSQIGDDATEQGLKTANKLMGSLQKQLDEEVFHLCTLDRQIYKVIQRVDNTMSIRCLSD